MLMAAPMLEPTPNATMNSEASLAPVMVDAVDAPPRMSTGFQLLRAMGWAPGTGLGKLREGRREPIAVRSTPEGLGLGFVADVDDDAIPSSVVAVMQVPSSMSDEQCLLLVGPWAPVLEYTRNAHTRQVWIRLADADKARAMCDFYAENQQTVHGADLSFALGPKRFARGRAPPLSVLAALAPATEQTRTCEQCGTVCASRDALDAHVATQHAPPAASAVVQPAAQPAVPVAASGFALLMQTIAAAATTTAPRVATPLAREVRGDSDGDDDLLDLAMLPSIH